MTGWQMIAVGVRRLVLARGELDRLEARICSEEGGAAPKGARSRENKGPAGGGGVAERGREESDATEEEVTRVGCPQGPKKKGKISVYSESEIVFHITRISA